MQNTEEILFLGSPSLKALDQVAENDFSKDNSLLLNPYDSQFVEKKIESLQNSYQY
ncbi:MULTISPECIES: hypothetical protein [unclassified Polaribacter]|uniref:hypothetical protein n=1 Tax=unclassified Polaribacter TaxID=196858 RepID=UPI00167492AD|nr:MULTISPECIES: hypothetical protein [unclassified Polaribacter]